MMREPQTFLSKKKPSWGWRRMSTRATKFRDIPRNL